MTLTIVSWMSVNILQTVCCCGCRSDKRPTWHQSTASLYTPVWRGRHRFTSIATQSLRHCVHQQKLNTHT